MSPLRRWFIGHGMPGWYSWVVVVGLTVVSNVLVLMITLKSADRRVDAERAAREQAQMDAIAAQETARRATCRVVVAQDEAYSDPATPPVTPAGRAAAKAWHELRVQLGCDRQ